jgi:hypothetical protein
MALVIALGPTRGAIRSITGRINIRLVAVHMTTPCTVRTLYGYVTQIDYWMEWNGRRTQMKNHQYVTEAALYKCAPSWESGKTVELLFMWAVGKTHGLPILPRTPSVGCNMRVGRLQSDLCVRSTTFYVHIPVYETHP